MNTVFTLGITICTMVLISVGCDESPTATQRSGGGVVASGERYADPKGFFSIVPPQGWRVQEYPQDPRGKVAFAAPNGDQELRVLAKAVNIADFDALIQSMKDVEKNLGVPMNIEPVVFNGSPAIKRTATVTIQGVTRKMLWIDLLDEGISHNVQYSSSPAAFDAVRDEAWKSMLTYEVKRQQQPASKEDAKKHEAAKWLRLAQISIEMGKTDAAKEAIQAGLETDPTHEELLKLKARIGAN
jgi:hypothetical protein